MVYKKTERDQLVEAAKKSESHPSKLSTGGGSTEKVLKRSVPEDHRHNPQVPAEKKPKRKDPANAVKVITPGTSSEDRSRQEASICSSSSMLTSCSAILQRPEPGPLARASTYPPPSDKWNRVSGTTHTLAVHAQPASRSGNAAMQGCIHPQPQKMSPSQLESASPQQIRRPHPTDNDLYIFVNALRSCLSEPEQPISREAAIILGDYLMRRNVLARLQKRQDVSISQPSNS